MTLQSSIPVLRSGDFERSRAFWTQTLGFSIAEEAGDPPRFGIFKNGKACVFINAWEGADPDPSPIWRAYFHTKSVDTLAKELRANGAKVTGPTDQPWGMREITLRDPDGNLICFGQDL